MRDLYIEGIIIHQYLENTPEGQPQIESDWLFFPEIKTLGSKPKKIVADQEKLLLKLIENQEAEDLSRRIIPEGEIEQESITIKLDPPRDMPVWIEPLELKFPYLIWNQNKLQVAYVPCLGVEIVIQSAKEKDEVLEDQLRFALTRRRISQDLFDLSLLQRCQELEVQRPKWNAYPMTPKERVMREEGDDDSVEPVLKEVGKRMDNRRKIDPVFERDSELESLAKRLKGKRGVSSLLLVGDNGVGKTALIQNLAIHQKELGLSENREMYHIPGSRIVAGMTGFGEWQDRCRKIATEASTGKGKILYFGNLLELLEVGRSMASSESVGGFFRPWMIRGQILAIAECTPAQLATIEQKDPRILEAFRQVKVEAPTITEARSILKQVIANQKSISMSAATQKRILLLHQRYSGYSALPGKLLYFTKRLITQNQPSKKQDDPTKITPTMVNRLFALESGLPSFLLDDSVSMDIDKVTAWFKERIKGQDSAINQVVDIIAIIKGRLSRPNRPLGSFLFVGPTGVGKTELAKTLAEYFYGSKDRLLRIDMSEYSTPGSANRLASGGPGEPEGILTSKMRDQPFSVVLLDEFEKADPSVFDLFLQVLGEARLTDGAGRLADFSNAMIILTSNLGAAEFKATAPGFADPDKDLGDLAIDHFVAAAKQRFRPEFFNRIGRIIPFLPLDTLSISEVIERELDQLDKRDGFKNSELNITIEPCVIDQLSAGGFDPRYGARPLKRTIESKILGPISNYLIEHPQLSSGVIKISNLDENDKLSFTYHPDDEKRDRSEREQIKTWNQRVPNLRRWLQLLANSSMVSELHSEVQRLTRKAKHNPAPRDHDQLAFAQKLLDRLKDDTEKIYQLEETLLITGFENQSYAEIEDAVESAPQWGDFCDLLRDTYTWSKKSRSCAVLLFTADNTELLSRFTGVYRDAGLEMGCQIRYAYFRRIPQEEDLHEDYPEHRKPERLEIDKQIEGLFNNRFPDNCLAIALEFTKPQVAAQLSQEAGVHQFISNQNEKNYVQLSVYDQENFKLENAFIPDEALFDREYRESPIRRSWNEAEMVMKDQVWGSSEDSSHIDPRDLPPEFNAEAINTLMEITLIDRALEMIRS